MWDVCYDDVNMFCLRLGIWGWLYFFILCKVFCNDWFRFYVIVKKDNFIYENCRNNVYNCISGDCKKFKCDCDFEVDKIV